jgi:thiamine pyrophosphate-dependent acetolactate synthase large subunit-like protein
MSEFAPVWVSDAVVDLLVEAGIEYVAFNPGATFRGLHDSLVNYRKGAPKIVLCPHEGVAVAVAHGYAKAAGRPMAVLLHDVVGLQHGSMAIYNAWCDRVPMLLLGGTGPLSTPQRRPWIDWIHTANVQAEQVRHYVKWDDQPADAASIPRALARALSLTSAQPSGPVYVCLDAGVQEQRLEDADWPALASFPIPSPPAAADAELDELAARLLEASLPALITDYAGDTEAGYESLCLLAEFLHAPVIDRGARHNLSVDHELNFTELPEILKEADVIVGIEVEDLFGALAGAGLNRNEPGGPAVINVGTGHLRLRSWSHAIGELPATDLQVTGSPQTVLPALLDRLRAVERPPSGVEARRGRLAGRVKASRAELWHEAQSIDDPEAVHPARLAAEAWEALSADSPLLVHSKPTDWERRLWPLAGFRAHLGYHGGGGLGYGLGASIGAALACREEQRLLVDLQPDGDLLYTPSALWTAAHLNTPILVLVQNNRQYRNTVEHAERMARARQRPVERRHVGAGLGDPSVDFAALARAFGIWSRGPVDRPECVASALRDAASVVRAGRPALVEVVCSGA